jgi:hypothetical protein
MNDARIGKFIQNDPISFPGGDVNLTLYVTNRPVRNKRPLLVL